MPIRIKGIVDFPAMSLAVGPIRVTQAGLRCTEITTIANSFIQWIGKLYSALALTLDTYCVNNEKVWSSVCVGAHGSRCGAAWKEPMQSWSKCCGFMCRWGEQLCVAAVAGQVRAVAGEGGVRHSRARCLCGRGEGELKVWGRLLSKQWFK